MPDSIASVSLMPGFQPLTVADRPLIRRLDRPLTQSALLAEALRLAAAIPPAPQVINICEDRGLFILALCGALARGIQTLLPASRQALAIEEVAAAYPGALCLCDSPVPGLKVPQVFSVKVQVVPETSASPTFTSLR